MGEEGKDGGVTGKGGCGDSQLQAHLGIWRPQADPCRVTATRATVPAPSNTPATCVPTTTTSHSHTRPCAQLQSPRWSPMHSLPSTVPHKHCLLSPWLGTTTMSHTQGTDKHIRSHTGCTPGRLISMAPHALMAPHNTFTPTHTWAATTA